MNMGNKKFKIENKKSKSPIFYFLFSILLFPSITFAFPGDLRSFVYLFFTTFYIFKPILIGLAFLLFFWGVAKFILSAGNEKELDNGKQFMLWGVLALFLLTSFWGIMQFLSAQFDFPQAGWPLLPTDGQSQIDTKITPDLNYNSEVQKP